MLGRTPEPHLRQLWPCSPLSQTCPPPWLFASCEVTVVHRAQLSNSAHKNAGLFACCHVPVGVCLPTCLRRKLQPEGRGLASWGSWISSHCSVLGQHVLALSDSSFRGWWPVEGEGLLQDEGEDPNPGRGCWCLISPASPFPFQGLLNILLQRERALVSAALDLLPLWVCWGYT